MALSLSLTRMTACCKRSKSVLFRFGRCLSTVPTSQLITSLSSKGGLSVKVADLTQVAHEITSQHACSPLASVALGRTLVGNALLAAGREENDICQVTIDGNGPLHGINTEVSFKVDTGYVRGYVGNPTAELPLREGGLLDVSSGVGIGQLRVFRSNPSRPGVLQQGSTMLETSEIGDDLVVYLLTSEQINSAMGLAVQIHEDSGGISSAVGFLCTVLPGCTDDELSVLEKNISVVSQLNQFMNKENNTIQDLMLQLMAQLGEQYRHSTPLIRQCSCSEEKFLQSFKLLGQEELHDIVNKNEKNEKIRCHWCNSETNIAPDTLKSLLTEN